MAGRPSRNTARLATILDHLPDALLLVDPMGAVVNANARAIEMFRAPGAPRPLIGRVVVDVLPGFGPAAEKPGRRRHGGSGSPVRSGDRPTERMLAKALDDSTFPVDVYRASVPWAGSDDHLLLVLHEAVDAPIESELMRTNQQAQAILRATEEAICGVDRNGKVVLANPAAARLLGARVGEVAGRDLGSLALHTRLDGSPYPAEDTPVGQALKSGKRSSRRREIVWRADGSPVPVDISTVAITDGEDVVGAVAAITDVTRGVEEERRRQRLVQILDAELTAGLAALAESDLTDPKVVAAELRRLQEIATDAVDYERLMGNQVTLEPVPTDVDDIVRDAVATIADPARERQISVEVVVEPCRVAADRRRLVLAVGELVRAAVHSSAPGASVAVSTGVSGEKVRIGVRETKVADSGQENPLLRWLRPRRGRQTGPDPDLAYVQIVVERHGGRFLLEPGQGGARSYVVELPTVTAGTVPAAPSVATAGAQGTAARNRHVRVGGEGEPQLADVVALRAEAEASVTKLPRVSPPPQAPVIPMPARSLRSVEPAADKPADTPAGKPAAASAVRNSPADKSADKPADKPAGQPAPSLAEAAVLVWPSATARLAAALGELGAPATGVARLQQVSATHAAAARVVVVDPLAGPVSRKTLGELRAAAARASLPILVAAGLTEAPLADAGSVLEPPVLLGALRAPGASGNARVLVIESDPALATALGAGLLKRNMQAVYARNSDEAMMRAALGAPDLVLLGLDGEDRPGIVDWLVNAKLLLATPVLAYTLEGMPPGYASRLERGASVVGVGARAESAAVDARLAQLVAHIGSV